MTIAMAEIFKFDVFIAYASTDAHYAKRLHALLSAIGYSVFLDSEALIGGDPWPDKIRQALQGSMLTLILISDRIDSAYFQQEEILEAIELARERRSRVVPVYLARKHGRSLVRHPLKQLHGIFWEEDSSLLSLALKIEAALKASRRYKEWQHEIVSETIVIVTGCHHIPEIYDRPSAYELKASVDYIGRSLGRSFLYSVVMGDIWFLTHSNIQDHPNVISIGSAGINSLSEIIVGQGDVNRKEKRWRIVRSGNRWALFGDLAEDTYDAVSSFKDRDLPGFLGELWSKP